MTTETFAPTAPIETVTPIKPSEAIRLGCLIAPKQLFGKTRDYSGGDRQKACAIGAMELGLGDASGNGADFEAFRRLRDMTPTTCPVDPTHEYHEYGVENVGWSDDAGPTAIAHLNDDHRWSRERIADWLEGLGL
jgi:hypothetical protein